MGGIAIASGTLSRQGQEGTKFSGIVRSDFDTVMGLLNDQSSLLCIHAHTQAFLDSPSLREGICFQFSLFSLRTGGKWK